MNNFFKDVAQADGRPFPAYVFIEPAYLPFGQNDQHPPHDVLKGDDLIASVYNAIRSQEKLWDSTLLILVWDEHGGFYDHVYPPPSIPPDHNTQEGFGFDQYGVRVPAVLISKWVKPGSVFAPREKVLDHTSILRFLTDKFNLGPLGNRVASAGTLDGAFSARPNENTPARVGIETRPEFMTEVTDDTTPELNRNQAALIEFSRSLELEMGAPPAEVGLRLMRATASLQSEVEVAKERTWLFIEQ